jgi:hypothetical protein
VIIVIIIAATIPATLIWTRSHRKPKAQQGKTNYEGTF